MIKSTQVFLFIFYYKTLSVTLLKKFCGCPYDFIFQFSFTPSHSTFGTHSTKYFFALIKIIFLQTIVVIISRYQKKFFLSTGTPYEENENFYIWGLVYQNRFWALLGPPYEQNEKFYIWGVEYQNGVKTKLKYVKNVISSKLPLNKKDQHIA